MINARILRLSGRVARTTGLVLASCAATAALSRAGEPVPGSLLVYCEFASLPGELSLLTVTNTNPSEGIDVEFVFLEEQACLEFNRTERLTANDTFNALSTFYNPQQQRGFVYAFAKSPTTGAAVAFDWLIGTSMQVSALDALDYGVDPIVFQSPLPEGSPTDADADGLRDLDGVEYAQAADRLQFPRFLGQDTSTGVLDELVLLNLTGGAQFSAVVSVLIYNDNEEVFSAQHEFRCWTKVLLADVSAVFTQDFLHDVTNHDPDEVVGAPQLEAGWTEIDGVVASSAAASIPDPVVLGFLVERVQGGSGADLPFGLGLQANGALLNRSVFPRLGSVPASEPARVGLPAVDRP